MSFILDALRKSEAARRRSETPDLFSTMHETPAPSRERANAPIWVVGVVGVLSLGIATWLFLQREPAQDPPVAAPPVDAPINAPINAPVEPARTGAATPAHQPEAAPPSATPSTPTVVPPPAAPPAPGVVAPTGQPPAEAAIRPAPAAELPDPPPANRPSANRPSASGDRAIALSELDAGSRKQLPALKMSVHMWNADAQRRFVILDGQRLGEGDMIGQATVESITRDGVVLNWQGARVWIEMR